METIKEDNISKLDHTLNNNSKLLLIYDVSKCEYKVFLDYIDNDYIKYIEKSLSKKDLKQYLNIDVDSEDYLEKCVLIKDVNNSIAKWRVKLIDFEKMPITTKLVKELKCSATKTKGHVVYINVETIKIPNSLKNDGNDLIVNLVKTRKYGISREDVINNIKYSQYKDKYVKGYSQLNLIDISMYGCDKGYIIELEANPNTSLTLIDGSITSNNKFTLVEGLLLKFNLLRTEINSISFVIEDIRFEDSIIAGCQDVNIYYIERNCGNRKNRMMIKNSDVFFKPTERTDNDTELTEEICDCLDNASKRELICVCSYVNEFYVEFSKLRLVIENSVHSYIFNKDLNLYGLGIRYTRYNIIASNKSDILNLFKDDIFGYNLPTLNLQKSKEEITCLKITCVALTTHGLNKIWKAFIAGNLIPLEDMIKPNKIPGVDDNLRKYSNNLIRSFIKLLKDNSTN